MIKGVKTSAMHEISCYVIFIHYREAAVELSLVARGLLSGR